MLPNDEDHPDDRDWPGVIKAIQARMKAERISDAELARRTRLAPNTLARIWMADSTFTEADLVNISTALGWHPHYVINILERQPHENIVFESPAEAAFRQRVFSRLDRIDEKIDQVLKDRDRTDRSG